MLKKMIAGAMALVALFSCSKEQDVPSLEASRTKSLQVTLKASRSEESTRAIFGVKDDGSGALTGLEMPETDVILRVAVKQGVNGTPLYQTIQFKKVAGRNYATYSGAINVPTGGSGEYFISAVHMSDVGGATHATIGGPNESYASYAPVSMLTKKDDQGKLNINVPYATQWQTLSATGDTALPVTLHLNPIGTLLRMRIKNEASSARQFTAIRVASNAIGYGGFFSFTEMFENGPLFRPGNSGLYSYSVPETISVEANSYSDWHYAWVYPRNGLLESARTVFGLRVSPATTTYTHVYETTQVMPKGSVPLTLVYREGHDATFGDLPETSAEFGTEVGVPKLSLEYLAEAPLNAAGTGFATSEADLGLFDFQQAQQFKSVRTIAGKRYSIGTIEEYKSIVPSAVADNYMAYPLSEGGLNLLETSIKIGNITQDYRSDYIYDSATETSYAVRFKNSSNYNRTAFRYTNKTNLNGVRALTIEAVYLGTSRDDITTVSTDKFWSDNAAKIVKRVIPLYGFSAIRTDTGEEQNERFKNTALAVWSSTALDVSTAYVARLGIRGTSHTSIYATHDRVAVIPFIR